MVNGDEPLKVGVVGMGWMGTMHAKAYASMSNVDLVGVAEVDEGRHAELTETFGTRVVRDAADLLADIDAVSICTPDHLHGDVTRQAFAAGVPVLLEKPMEVSSDAARALLAARTDPAGLMIGHILRFDPRVIRTREIIQSGELGQIWHAQIWRQTTRSLGATPAERTSVAWFLGIHDADLLMSLVGRGVESVSAVGRKLVSDHWDVVHTNLRFTDGLVATMDNAWTWPSTRPSRALSGLRLVGAKGAIEIDLGHTDLRLAMEGEPAVHMDTYNWPSRTSSGPYTLLTEVETFVDCVRAGTVPPITGEDGLAAVELVELIHESLDSGKATSPKVGTILSN